MERFIQALPLLEVIWWGPAEVIWDHAICRVPGKPTWRGPLLARGLPSLNPSEGCPVPPAPRLLLAAMCGRAFGSNTSSSLDPVLEAGTPDGICEVQDICGSWVRRCGLPRAGDPLLGVKHSGPGRVASGAPWGKRPTWRLTGGNLLGVLRNPRIAWGLRG